jgi:hypothetical protein
VLVAVGFKNTPGFEDFWWWPYHRVEEYLRNCWFEDVPVRIATAAEYSLNGDYASIPFQPEETP